MLTAVRMESRYAYGIAAWSKNGCNSRRRKNEPDNAGGASLKTGERYRPGQSEVTKANDYHFSNRKDHSLALAIG